MVFLPVKGSHGCNFFGWNLLSLRQDHYSTSFHTMQCIDKFTFLDQYMRPEHCKNQIIFVCFVFHLAQDAD